MMPSYMQQPMPDVEMDALKRARLYAQTLREGAQKNIDQGGQMVGNIYVPRDTRGDYLNQALAGGLDFFTGQGEQGLTQKRQAEEQAWLGQMPSQTTQTPTWTEEQMQFGPSPEAPAGGRAVPKTADQLMQDYQAWGQQAPVHSQTGSALRQALLTKSLQRPFEMEEREEKRATALELAREKAAEQARRDRERAEDRAAEKERDRTLRMTLAEMTAGTRGANADLDRQLKELRIEAEKRKLSGETDGKPLPVKIETEAREAAKGVRTVQALSSSFKDEYAGGPKKVLERAVGNLFGGAAPADTNEMARWWSDQAMFDELVQRHEMFGATLTSGEQAAWKAAAISPNLDPKDIRARLSKREELYKKMLTGIKESYEAAGFSKRQIDAITKDVLSGSAPPPPGPPAQAPGAAGRPVPEVPVPGAPGGVEEWTRDPVTGKLVRK